MGGNKEREGERRREWEGVKERERKFAGGYGVI